VLGWPILCVELCHFAAIYKEPTEAVAYRGFRAKLSASALNRAPLDGRTTQRAFFFCCDLLCGPDPIKRPHTLGEGVQHSARG